MLRPGIWFTFTGVTLEPRGFDVFPGLFNPEKKKSSATTMFGFLQIFPFTNTANLIQLVYAIRRQKIVYGNEQFVLVVKSPEAAESLTATQKSCRGLGSDAYANDAKDATRMAAR